MFGVKVHANVHSKQNSRLIKQNDNLLCFVKRLFHDKTVCEELEVETPDIENNIEFGALNKSIV